MNRQVLGKLLLLSCTFGGCGFGSEDVVIRQAVQERDAAYIRLAKAITSYCSVSAETVDARQTCILERRLALEQSENGPRMAPTALSRSPLPSAR